MIKAGKMTKAGLSLFREAAKKKSRAKIIKRRLAVPADLKRALAKNMQALKNFDAFAPSYQKMYIWWIKDAKKRETRDRRIKRVVLLAAENKKSVML
jgi:uncharacterized protein YdeI (YjbR/CyaY-like superfamily)